MGVQNAGWEDKWPVGDEQAHWPTTQFPPAPEPEPDLRFLGIELEVVQRRLEASYVVHGFPGLVLTRYPFSKSVGGIGQRALVEVGRR